MGIFNRRRKATNPPLNDAELLDRLPKEAAPIAAKSGLLRLLPIGDIIKGITGVLRDPNGKISSKRAGAGALITSGIYFLDAGHMPNGIVCLSFALALFILTQWEGTQPE
jgi:hypothetical protein